MPRVTDTSWLEIFADACGSNKELTKFSMIAWWDKRSAASATICDRKEGSRHKVGFTNAALISISVTGLCPFLADLSQLQFP